MADDRKLTRLECRRCSVGIDGQTALRDGVARRFVRAHLPHGELYGGITVRDGRNTSTSIAHFTLADLTPLTPAERVKAALFGDVLHAFATLMTKEAE
jgi:hypothetical protein